uniref:7TM_GPCR_Srx domain-containing protein n=1 Tax=Caenorhabditis tropicalis TaxID=1561998 RepID=A0A1I7TNQ1_9PELO
MMTDESVTESNTENEETNENVFILHLFWIFYCFSTVPVFMTAISSISQESCNQNISICFEALGLLNDFQLKMFVGVATQIFFVGMLYVEMKRLCLLLQFPFSKFETIRIQLNEMEDTSFDNSTANELPAKNPNDIVIAA